MTHHFVIPASAGIQTDFVPRSGAGWIPAFAGMTGEVYEGRASPSTAPLRAAVPLPVPGRNG